MIIENMRRVERSIGEIGAIYYQEIELMSGESNAYIIPSNSIYAIGVNIENGNIYFTLDTEEKIENDTANWIVWDGMSKINLAVTAWYFEYVSGTAKCQVTVKTNEV